MTKQRMQRSTRVSTSLLHYRGPIHPRLGNGEPTVAEANITSTSILSSDGVGEVFQKFTTAGVTTLTEWTAWSDIYDEYRVLAMEFTYEPLKCPSYPGTTTTPPIGVLCTRNGNSLSVPATVAEAVNTTQHKKWNMGKSITMEWRMNGSDEAAFIPVSTAVDNGGFFATLGSGTASTAFGRWYITFLVQFKGRR